MASPRRRPPRHPPTRHKSIRIDPILQALISARMIAENCDESTAMRNLMFDGAKAPRPRPVLAQVAPPATQAQFAADMLLWHRDFLVVRPRLTLALPDPSDIKLCALITKWRALADDLEARARVLGKTASSVAKASMGIDEADCVAMARAKLAVTSLIQVNRERMNNPDANAEARASSARRIPEYEAILRALALFGF